jgi:hypothetical protein
MKLLPKILIIILFILVNVTLKAQTNYTVSGTIYDEKGAALKAATVFLNESKKVTATNDAGQFRFLDLEVGTFQLTVKMLGYHPTSQNVIIKDKSINVHITLVVKPIILKEVIIGKDNNWNKNYQIFKDQFLGRSANTKMCVITNPKVISFITNKQELIAEADEFLIIDNKELGYRIHYLLKNFHHNINTYRTSYDGDMNFEEMKGTEKQEQQWSINRLKAYKGSFMHFLRSVYTNSALNEGFIARQIHRIRQGNLGPLSPDPQQIDFDTVVTPVDTSVKSMKFNSIYVMYDPSEATKLLSGIVKTGNKQDLRYKMANTGTIVNLNLKEAIIDRKGSYADYRTFLLQGYWGRKRIGNQLPFEYQPPLVK